jgi:multiple sugar transport system permease protein
MAYIGKQDKQWIYADPENPSDQVMLPPATPDDRVRAIVFNWSNYAEALTKSPFPLYMWNTVIIMVLATIGTVVSTTLVGYGFSRFYFRGRNFLFLIVLSTMMLPPQVSLIPSFIMFQRLGWYNTYLPLIVPAFFAVSAWDIFLMRQFLMGIPTELDDAAKIDGCGPIKTLLYVIAPQAIPVLITITLFAAVYWWNEYFYSLIYLQDKMKYTVALGLQSFDSLYFNNNALKAAATVMMMSPPIFIFFFFQRYFVQGTVVSGVKG